MGDHDLAIISSIILFVSFFSFLELSMPTAYQFVTIDSLTWFTGGTILVATACATSVVGSTACVVGIGLYTLSTFLATYFTTSLNWVEALIFTPISLILIVFISKLARGQ